MYICFQYIFILDIYDIYLKFQGSKLPIIRRGVRNFALFGVVPLGNIFDKLPIVVQLVV